MSDLERRLAELLAAVEDVRLEPARVESAWSRAQAAFAEDSSRLSRAEVERALSLHACLRASVERRLRELHSARASTVALRELLTRLARPRAHSGELDVRG